MMCLKIAFYCIGEIFMNFVYIVRCKDNTLYTGWTNNLEKRIDLHNKGKGAKYTKTRCPVQLEYYEEFENKQEAMRREYRIKKMTRIEKLNLIKSINNKCK
jgi:putative endonuclease